MKRKYGAYGPSSSSGRRRPTKIPRPLTTTVGPVRTGGNYNQVRRYYDSKRGAYRVSSGPERKYIDNDLLINISTIAFAANSPGSSGAATLGLVNGLGQGTDATQRLGRKVMLKSIQWRWAQTLASSAAGTADAGRAGGTVRHVLVYDSQSNGAAPTAADVFQLDAPKLMTSPLNLSNRERFKVICDKTMHLDTESFDTNYRKFFKKCNYPMIFNSGNAGTIADIQTGGIYGFWMSDSQATGAGTISARYYIRIRFEDD